MGKIAFLFSGQGAQYIGMGKDFYDNYSIAKEVFNNADAVLGYDISKICFQGPEEELVKTENTQPAILATSIAILRVIEEELSLKANVTAGLSLGEYTSLVYSEALSFDDAIKLVNKRGKYMQEAVPLGKGTMAAIMGLDRDNVNEVIGEASQYGLVEGANYNCPGQIVISGEILAVEKACELAKAKGAKRAMVLPVSAPFHSSMLKNAGDKLNNELKDVKFSKPIINVISNVNGKYINDNKDIKDLLIKQVSNSVLWEDTIELMLRDGIDIFIEIGPGKALTGFAKKIAKANNIKVNCINVENISGLDSLKEFLK